MTLAPHGCTAIAEALISAGVPCGPVRGIDQVVEDEHTGARGMVVAIDDYLGTGNPIKLSRTPASYRLKPPRFAEHTGEIMAVAGIDPAAYANVLPGDLPGTPASAPKSRNQRGPA